jgi:hypothetical protein
MSSTHLLAYAYCFHRLEVIRLVEETLSETDDYLNTQADLMIL